MSKKLFIAFEGIDGCGKSTQSKILYNRLEQIGHKVYATSEPTDSPIGTLIQNIFTHQIDADHRTIAGLFVADRLDHLLNKNNGILKKLDNGFTVVMDRYYFSSYAYQGSHVPLEWVIEANSLSAGLLRPDLNVFIDIDPKLSIDRLHSSRETIELYETFENLKNVRNKFFESFELLKKEERIFITDGNRAPELIASDIWNEVAKLL